MKRYAPYILILLILVGLFGPVARVNAQYGSPSTTGTIMSGTAATTSANPAAAPATGGTPTAATPATATADEASKATGGATDIKNMGLLKNIGCSFANPEDCLQYIVYALLIVVPSLLLTIAGIFFDALLNIGLNSELFHAIFVSQAWAMVRDLSNVFFILILLYIAIQTILGLGHETKKMIVHVIIMALLINFSMFFTKVVIDSSNILALVFYNKITVNTESSSVTKFKEKPISGKLTSAFKPYKLLSQEFFERAKVQSSRIPTSWWKLFTSSQYDLVKNLIIPSYKVPPELMVGIMIISGTIMLFAAYSFFVVGLLFLSRLIELWVLIIFSPFAFMSWSVPKLRGVEGIGWEAWLKRLLEVSFMAPIFMFFLYLIVMLINFDLFNGLSENPKDQSTTEAILFVIIPALVILIILHKATKYAKKASGELGEAMMKYGKMAGGLALGVAGGGAGLALRAGVGGLAASAASSKTLQEGAKKAGWEGMRSRMALGAARYGTKASFDIRNIPGAGALAKAGGFNLESSKAIGLGTKEGGYEKMRADKVKKRQERAKQLEVREDEGLKQNLNTLEIDLQELRKEAGHEIEKVNDDIEKARQEAIDVERKYTRGSTEHNEAENKLQFLKDKKQAIKTGGGIVRDQTTGKFVSVNGPKKNGKSISDLEKEVPEAKEAITHENRERKWKYAARQEGKDEEGNNTWMFWRGNRTNREAGHKIRMENEIKSSGGEKEHFAHAPVSTPKPPAPPSGSAHPPAGGAPHP